MTADFESLLSTYLAELRAAIRNDPTPSKPPPIERLPAPNLDQLAKQNTIPSHHPLSGYKRTLNPNKIDSAQFDAWIDELFRTVTDLRHRFLILWRALPDIIADHDSNFRFLPADIRIPDTTIWQHCDTVAAFAAAGENRALLSFNLGPVQQFISAARSVRDLWSGSAILSWVTFRAMIPILRAYGPTAMVFPALRGVPFVDLWLRVEENLSDVKWPSNDARKAPTIPNRFLALVPYGDDGTVANELATQCEEAARAAWESIAESVHEAISPELRKADPQWDRRWRSQINSFFDIRTSVLPVSEWDNSKIMQLYGGNSFADTWPDAAKMREFTTKYPTDIQPGDWQASVDLSSRVMEAARRVRHVPAYSARVRGSDKYPPKCMLLGTYEQMGPNGLRESHQFWDAVATPSLYEGVALRPQERFSAIALAKRFSAPAHFARALSLSNARKELRFDDTHTIAARLWLEHAELDPSDFDQWNGMWLHYTQRDEDTDDPVSRDTWEKIGEARKRVDRMPPTYYAVLQMDGDHMGRWLAGEKTPKLRDVYHDDIVDAIRADGNETLLDARRPVTPEYHAAISEALTNFAVIAVPEIIEKYRGTVIYAGGDDVLALLPTRNVVQCAHDLRKAFSGELNGDKSGYYHSTHHQQEYLMMGANATASAGIAVVHTKEDLRFALEIARKAESNAKSAGRNKLHLVTTRRSGESTSATCTWSMTDVFTTWLTAFENGASDRWAYHLRTELPTLRTLDDSIVEAMIQRRIKRADDQTKHAFESIVDEYRAYAQEMRSNNAADGETPPLESFLALVQSASFMVRGRDM